MSNIPGLDSRNVIISSNSRTALHVQKQSTKKTVFNVNLFEPSVTVRGAFYIVNCDTGYSATFDTSLMTGDVILEIPATSGVVPLGGGGAGGSDFIITVGKTGTGTYDFEEVGDAITEAAVRCPETDGVARCKILVYPGTYTVSETVLTTSMCICGAPGCDKDAVVLVPSDPSNTYMFSLEILGARLELKGLTIDWNSTPAAESFSSVRVTAGNEICALDICDCCFLGSTASFDTNIELVHVDVNGNAAQIFLKDVVSYLLIPDGAFSEVHFLRMTLPSSLDVLGCSSTTEGDPTGKVVKHLVYVFTVGPTIFPSKFLVDECSFTGGANAVDFNGLFMTDANIIFSRCTIKENTETGILVSILSTNATSDIIVDNCYVLGETGEQAFEIGSQTRGASCVISNCIVDSNEFSPLRFFRSPASNLTFMNDTEIGGVRRDFNNYNQIGGSEQIDAADCWTTLGAGLERPKFVIRSTDGGVSWTSIPDTYRTGFRTASVQDNLFTAIGDIVAIGFEAPYVQGLVLEAITPGSLDAVIEVTRGNDTAFASPIGHGIYDSQGRVNFTMFPVLPLFPGRQTMVLKTNSSPVAGIIDGNSGDSVLLLRLTAGTSPSTTTIVRSIRGCSGGALSAIPGSLAMVGGFNNSRKVVDLRPSGGNSGNTVEVWYATILSTYSNNGISLANDYVTFTSQMNERIDTSVPLKISVALANVTGSTISSSLQITIGVISTSGIVTPSSAGAVPSQEVLEIIPPFSVASNFLETIETELFSIPTTYLGEIETPYTIFVRVSVPNDLALGETVVPVAVSVTYSSSVL